MNTSNLLIIGGGITGMTAAIYAARANLSVTILEKEVCGGLVNWTHTVENMPSYKSIHGIELMEKSRAHVESLGVNIVEVDEVESVDFTQDFKSATTTMGDVYAAKAVIVATGRKPNPFPLETDFPNIHYCAICDGSAYKNKDVIILGGGNAGFDESLFLLQLGIKSIHIVEAFPQCVAAKSTQEAALETGKVKVSTNTKIIQVEDLGKGKAKVYFENSQNNKVFTEIIDAIFVFIGQKPLTQVFEGILEMDKGYIITNQDMHTNIKGVFAAGDVIVKKYRQITTAMSDGTIAALEAEKFIRSIE
ncbi:NAD(P)/FAD-dependent oxidoreductase [Desulfovibrio litoralis]|uniref:Thioredoxin reductase (NADPH) n=1 Tax=Desulfovibrio litoralis DSM 11393 TaxID=1121455 RepID=A0A1M7SML8_9BACT|nr:NAD(P)/FAD-dependent oxidoreductase [Desulfovibrio litoralis]SHN59725.1 thioredoxin reductase (NADPH) [Desulfovibrio litoralis DSM 11393]